LSKKVEQVPSVYEWTRKYRDDVCAADAREVGSRNLGKIRSQFAVEDVRFSE
jgi:hypothetical protein